MNVDPLAGLRDIHLPPDIGWWPPAPGWWLVAAVAVAFIVFTVFRVVKFIRGGRYRKESLVLLRGIIASYRKERNCERALQDVSVLLRRAALQAFGRHAVAGLIGDEWLRFLDRTGSTDAFTSGPGAALGRDLYMTQSGADPEALFPVAENWIRKHK